MDNVNSQLINIIQTLLKRPGMYNINRVEDIALIILGYQFAISKTGDNAAQIILNDFRKYVNLHFSTNSDHSWERLIRFYSAGDSHSIKLFNKLFDEFISSATANVPNSRGSSQSQ